MAEPNNLVLTFGVYRDGKLVKTVEYTTESITIGSGDAALLTIPDAGLSELHAVLNVQGDGSVQLLDLGSEAGTKLNGQRISNAAVSSGDEIGIGSVRIKLTITEDDAYEDEEATVVAEAMNFPEPHKEAPVTSTDTGAPEREQAFEIEEEDDHTEEQESLPAELQTEDIMSFIMRSGTAQSSMGIDRKKPKVLEINQIWGEMLLDTKHFTKGHKTVSIGSSVGWKWNLLGIDMGWVPAPLHLALPYAPPMWSEVQSEWKDDFYAPDTNLPGGHDHDLFVWTGDGFTAEIAEGWDGFVDVGEKRLSFDDLVAAGKATKSGSTYSIPMTDDTRLMVDVDGVIFFAHMVYPGRRVLASMTDDIDYPFIGIFGLWAFLGLMFGILMATLPPPPKNEMVEIPDRFVDLILQEPDKQEIEKKPDNNPEEAGSKAKRDEGKVGKKDAKMEKAKGNKVEMAKQQQDRQIAENAGVLGALREGSELDGVFGSSGLSSDITGGIGGLIGAKGIQIGAGGLGSRGSGLGGGGSAEGLGGLGTKGIGSGASGYGAGGGHFGAKGDGAIGAVGGDPIILGALDRSLIDEVIRRHMNQIRYCYQRELTRNHTLGGKIVIKFVIAKDGSVSSANVKSTTMNSSSVEQCVAGRFMRMQFPKPKGGGIVIVSYPFLFSPG